MSDPGPIKFPPPRPAAANLSLPRRRPGNRPATDALDASAAARESINALFSGSRSQFSSSPKPPELSKLADLERTLRQLELTLAERERLIADAETRLVEKERDVAEAEALVAAREQLLAAVHRPALQEMSVEAARALEKLREELERQEATLKEQKQFIREREQFLDESEAKLFEKVQAQQDKENELEQREEDLRARDRRVREREASFDPQAAAALHAEDEAAQKRDEFSE
jgi:chromosome segregation ATPase